MAGWAFVGKWLHPKTESRGFHSSLFALGWNFFFEGQRVVAGQ